MRLWTLHPKYLDSKGLVALWREALLAQKVLRGLTKGYRHHPQLIRFQAQANPVAAVAAYLTAVHEEATRRGYEFDCSKIARCQGQDATEIIETKGQLLYEWEHLKRKLKKRAPKVLAAHKNVSVPEAHSIFKVVSGKVREWEIASQRPPQEKIRASSPRLLRKTKRQIKPALSARRPASIISARRRRTSLRRKS